MDLEQKSIERIRLASELSLQHYKQPLICTEVSANCTTHCMKWDIHGLAASAARWRENTGGKSSQISRHTKERIKKHLNGCWKRSKKAEKVTRWKNAEEVFLWWMEDENVEEQMSFWDFPEVIPEEMRK